MPTFNSSVLDLVTKPLNCPSDVAIGDAVYIDSVDHVTQSSAASMGTAKVLGFVIAKPTTTTCIVQVAGNCEALSGLTPGSIYYLSNTPGAISLSAGSTTITVGSALDTTTLALTSVGQSGSGGGGSGPFIAGAGAGSAVLAGAGNVAIQAYSVAEGGNTTVSGTYAHAEGFVTAAGGIAAHAEGYKTNASAEGAHVEGGYTAASYAYAHAEGAHTKAYGVAAHAEGEHTTAYGKGAHAEGGYSTASGSYAHSGGSYAVAAGYGSHSEGLRTVVGGKLAHGEGYSTSAMGYYSHTEGFSAQANGKASHTEGILCTAGQIALAFTVSGTTVTLTGNQTFFFTNGDTVLFWGTPSTQSSQTKTISAVAFGSGHTTFTIDSPLLVITAGSCSNVTKYGQAAHAEGNGTVAKGNFSHAEGNNAQATGNMSHAEGYYTTASGTYSHAEGDHTTASSLYAHAEGYRTTASQHAAHAEGFHTTASGKYGHVEGGYSTASGPVGAHAEGFQTVAHGSYAHAGGAYASASHWAEFARGNIQFANPGDSQFSDLLWSGATTDGTPTELFLDGASATQILSLPVSTAFSFVVRVIAFQQVGGGGASAQFIRTGVISRVGGTTAIVGTVQTIGTDIGSNAGVPPVDWAVTLTADNGTSSLILTVTGAAATNIRWVAKAEVVQVSYP